MVYSTLAGDQYDKVIVPHNEGATTKTTLTGKRGGLLFFFFLFSVCASFLELFIMNICRALTLQCVVFFLMPSVLSQCIYLK